MKIVSDKIQRLKKVTEDIKNISEMIERLEYYAKEKIPARGEGGIRVYDIQGKGGVSVESRHLLAYPGAIRELYQLRLQVLEKERDEITEVLSVAERLFESIGRKS